ncbi:F-box/kelch-repeat protein [Acorus calamus]|uniref:F-box/kelch-repeat protein n=1 Tax=Acorus calamus TaxID=4465 RepID=A0AAV9CNN7_ACOCL|nr:F-box/kelch-repeat protein [Acorus calamus]
MLEGQSCMLSRALLSSCEQESNWVYLTYRLLDPPCKRSMEDEEGTIGRPSKRPNSPPSDPSDAEDVSDSNSLIHTIGRDISINCLIVEHWIYFSCNVLEWQAFDPHRQRWMHLPRMPSNDCFMFSDKESLAVGTELLVFGKEVTSHIILKYSILTNSWTPGIEMRTPRCLFGSASLGECAILAGGCDAHGAILSSAELYNSESQTWVTLPSMNKPRKMCSGVFMDGKFYVIGGMASNTESLNCGEEFSLETNTWRVIENMFPRRAGATGAPPLVAVVNNELYSADYAEKEVRKYDKKNNLWITLGRLPERPDSMNGWGLAFRACGDRLIVIGGPRVVGGGIIELNSWIPKDGPPEWTTIASKPSGHFVYNCAVMGC